MQPKLIAKFNGKKWCSDAINKGVIQNKVLTSPTSYEEVEDVKTLF